MTGKKKPWNVNDNTTDTDHETRADIAAKTTTEKATATARTIRTTTTTKTTDGTDNKLVVYVQIRIALP